MREDLISFIAKQKRLTHVVMTTFNIDFVFIENILLRQLRRCGHPSLTIFADADEAAGSFASQGKWLSKIGRRYRIVPVRMEPGYRFHPKITLLSGEDAAHLFVGSGNLTFGGMRQNEEAWLHFTYESDGPGPFAACRSFMDDVLARVPEHTAARSEIAEAFSRESHAWASELGDPNGLLWKVGRGPSLGDRIESIVGDSPVDRVMVISPYFDDEATALARFCTRWPDAEIEVIIQPKRAGLTVEGWHTLPDPKRLRPMVTTRDGKASPFIHAKCYAFVAGDMATVFVGSGNCTHAAMTIPGSRGNAEALAHSSIPATQLDDVLLAGLQPAEEAADLPQSIEEEQQPARDESRLLRIDRARYTGGELLISFTATGSLADAVVITDTLDLHGSDVVLDGSMIRIRGIGCPERVALRAIIDGVSHVSNDHWVDHELVLSTSNRQRAIANAISEHVAAGQWSLKGWSEVFRLFGDHLAHNPDGTAAEQADRDRPKHEPESIPAEAFFSEDYRLPRRSFAGLTFDEDARVAGLGGLLARYFGGDDDGIAGETEAEDDADDDVVDRPEDIKERDTSKQPPRRRDATETERRRARRVATKVVKRITDDDFIADRPATLLSSDLAITAVLLVSGHAEGWLQAADFVDFTYRVWTHLFFDAGKANERHAPMVGALPARHAGTSEPGEFRGNLATTQLASALAIWCLSTPDDVSHDERARFMLATRLAVAHAPWLWSTPERGAFASEMAEVATRTGWLGPDAADRWNLVLDRWERIYNQGRALAALEAFLNQNDLTELRQAIDDDGVPQGTLLWQGSKLGFCILAQSANRRSPTGHPVAVLTLRSTKRDTNLGPDYLLPFRSLLTLAATRAPERVTQRHVEALTDLANHLESAMSNSV